MDEEIPGDEDDTAANPEDRDGLHQPHDKLFSVTFREPANTAALLRAGFPADLAAAIDWETFEHQSGSFVDPEFRRAHTDLLFTAKLHGQETFFYVLFEHQSTRDPRLALRLLHYMVCIWMHFVARYPWPHKLPSILPVVLSQNAEPWEMPERFSELLDIPDGMVEPLRPYVPDFGFRHLQLAGMEYGEIPGTPPGMYVLRAMKAERLGELLGSAVWDEGLIAQVPDDLLEMVLRYILDGEVDRKGFEAKVKKIANPELRSKAMTLAQVYRQEGRKEGRQEGLHRGLQESVVEALELRFGEVPVGLAEAVRSVDEEAVLRRLHRAAIQCGSLEEFSGSL